MNTLDVNRTYNAGASGPKAATDARTEALASKDTFLQLLVAQMRYQNPLQPTDGVQFVTQLAQFTGLEQSIQLKDEVASVRKAIEDLTAIVRNADADTAAAAGGQNT